MNRITNTVKKDQHFSWLFGGNPKAIIQQEKKGQEELITSQQLPLKCSDRITNAMVQYGKMKILVLGFGQKDELFGSFQLPEGWEKKPTDHDMWSDLIDNKGRKRASIFYKASFYDRDAFVTFNRRISCSIDRVGFLDNDYTRSNENDGYKSDTTPFQGRVIDYDGKVLFQTQSVPCKITYDSVSGGYTREYCDLSSFIKKDLQRQCNVFLQEKFPNHEDINAYWD